MKSEKEKKPLILMAVTSPQSMGFFKGQISYFIENGFDVALLTSKGLKETEGAKLYEINMKRNISLYSDLISFFRILVLLFKIKPDIVSVGTPKASLLISVAAKIARVPNRIYTCHGLRFETLTGFKRKLLINCEKLIIKSSTKVLCVSQSLKEKVLKLEVKNKNKVEIIYKKGSCNGVDIEVINKKENLLMAFQIKEQLNLPKDAFVFGFIGRITTDKGINELIEAFEKLKEEKKEAYLLICGKVEGESGLSKEVLKAVNNKSNNIIYLGFQKKVYPIYHVIDALVLPTYREGFGNVLIEANAAKKPVIASSVTGCVDAVEQNITGLLVKSKDINELKRAMHKILTNPDMASKLGLQGYERVQKYFNQDDFKYYFFRLYKELLK